MKNELVNVTIDELILLSEGELATEARDDLFRRLDEHPQQWRTCAIAVLEAKAVAHSMHKIRDQLSPMFSATSPTSNDQSEIYLADRDRSWLKQTARPSPRRMRRWYSIASVLLALTFGLLLGYQANTQLTKHIDDPSNDKMVTEELGRVRDANIRLASVQLILKRLNVGDERLLAVVQLDQNGSASFVPVVESPRMAEQFRRNPLSPIPSRDIREANRAGWNITQQRQLLAIESPGKEVKLLPVGMWNLKPVGRNVL